MKTPKEVWITGIGILSSLGEGLDAHWEALNARRVNVDETRFAPYIVHPLPPVSFDSQIPKRGDQRQMETWQRLGVYAAGAGAWLLLRSVPALVGPLGAAAPKGLVAVAAICEQLLVLLNPRDILEPAWAVDPDPLLWDNFRSAEMRQGPVVNAALAAIWAAGRALGLGHGMKVIARRPGAEAT